MMAANTDSPDYGDENGGLDIFLRRTRTVKVRGQVTSRHGEKLEGAFHLDRSDATRGEYLISADGEDASEVPEQNVDGVDPVIAPPRRGTAKIRVEGSCELDTRSR